MEKTLKSLSINYGLYLGLALTVITVLVYALYLDLFTEWWFGILLILMIIGFGLAASLKSKTLLGGFISFKQSFTSYFITVAVGTLISTVVGIVIFTVVDPEAAKYIDEKIIEMTVQTMENWGAPQQSINETIANMEGTENFSLGAQVQSYFVRLVILSLLGLIVAVAVKKKDPSEA